MTETAILNIFDSLELTSLNEEWVEQMHSSEFTEEPGIDLEFPAAISAYLDECNNALRGYTVALSSSSLGQARCSLLNELIQSGVTSKMIQSWTYYIFHKGLKGSATFEEKRLSILAADLYFLLLKLPGMSSSELYHAIIFEKSINTLQMAAQIDMCVNSGSTSQGRKRKSNLPPSQSQKRRKQNTDATQTEEGEEEALEIITPIQSAAICKLLMVTLHDFCQYMATVSLRSNEVSLKHAVQVLVKIANYLRTNCPVSVVDYSSFKVDGSTATSLKLPYQLVIYGLFLTVSVKHGDLDQLCLNLFRFILPILIMQDANAPSSTVPRAFFQNSEIFRRLVCHLYSVHGEAVAHSISVLTQNLIAQCPDRTEFRNHVAVIVTSVLQHMPLLWYADFCNWLRRVSVHTKIVYRSNALVVIGKLLCLPERAAEDALPDDPDVVVSTKHGYLLKIVIGRLMDVAPSVRSRALHVLIEIMEEGIVSQSALQQVVNLRGKDLETETPAPSSEPTRKTNTPLTLHSVPASLVSNSCSVVAETSTLLQLLAKCALEPKAMVRKTAVCALEMALKYGFLLPGAESMVILEGKCRDPSLMVRKQAIVSISEVLLHHNDCPQAQASWSKGVLPAILDAESSVQEKAAALIESTILNNFDASEAKRSLAWNLVSFFASPKGESLRAYLQTVCRQWKRQMKLDTPLVNKIVLELENPDRSAGAWVFLRFLTLYTCNKTIAAKIASVWFVEYKKENNLMFHIYSIITLGQVCNYLPVDTQQKIMDICIQRLKMPQCPIQLISYLVETTCNIIEALYKDKADAPQWPQPLMEWCEIMLKDCDEYLYKFIMSNSGGTILNEQSLVHQLYIAGNIGKHCATKVPKRLVLALQALLTSTESLTTLSQVSSSQDMLSQPLSQFVQTGGVPQQIRAHAVINLGKICLHNSQLAKKCVPAMVRELDTCDHEMVRNNVLIVLTDLCVQQTQLVDPYIADMANSLGDESGLMRRHTLILLNSLLKKDYVKWRGSLIFKFLVMLCDKNVEIRTLVRFSLINQTLRRNAGDVFFRHFVESIFYFNVYTDHNVFNRFPKSDREKRLFNFSGEERVADRMLIYSFMLEHMDDGHRIKLTGKLCSDILDGIVDGVIPVNKAHDVLADALAVLCSQDLKLKCMNASEEDQDMEGMQNEAATNVAKNAMKQKIISHVVKRNLLENIIPIIIALKNTLVAHKSPLVRNVMLCLKEIMKEYKTEVQDILTADKQLATEIEFDLKRFDREQEERQQREQIPDPSVSGTPNSHQLPQAAISPETPRQPPPASATPGRQRPQTPSQIAVSSAGRVPGPPIIRPPAPQQNTHTPTRSRENVHPLATSAQFLSPGTALKRQKSMGITAILNSARKTMNLMKINGHENDNSPRRAISTPARTTALGDLTFSNMTEISAILTPVEHPANN